MTTPMSGRAGDLNMARVMPLRQVAATLGRAADQAKIGRPVAIDTDLLASMVDLVLAELTERRAELLRNMAADASELESATYRLLNGESGSTLRLVGAAISLKAGLELLAKIQRSERAGKAA